METIDLETGAFNPICNANGPNLPDPDNFFTPSGLPAPRPPWVYPQTARTLAQTSNDYRSVLNVGEGENEVNTIAGVAWSQADSLFYVTAGLGFNPVDVWADQTVKKNIFTMTPDGVATAIGNTRENPAVDFDLRGIAVYHPVPGQTILLAGGLDTNKITVHEFRR